MSDELLNTSQQEFYFDSPNFQDSLNIAFSRMVLHLGHIGQHLHAYQLHNYFQMSSLAL